jgi:hypothetical protein
LFAGGELGVENVDGVRGDLRDVDVVEPSHVVAARIVIVHVRRSSPWPGVLVGASISGLFVLIGAVVAARNEHARWLRDQRYTVWTDALAPANEVLALGVSLHPHEVEPEDRSGWHADVLSIMGQTQVLGPQVIASMRLSSRPRRCQRHPAREKGGG